MILTGPQNHVRVVERFIQAQTRFRIVGFCVEQLISDRPAKIFSLSRHGRTGRYIEFHGPIFTEGETNAMYLHDLSHG